VSSDLPDYALLYPLGAEPRFTGFPHRLVLRPEGVSVVAGPVSAAFLIDPDCGLDVLNGAALAHYLEQRVPVLIQAQRARDLRPFLRRRDSFRQRGYVVEALS
jgi:hypothetical protein